MIAQPHTGSALSIEDRELLDRMQDLLRRIERTPDTTLPRAHARAAARGLATRKYTRISKDRLDPYGPGTQEDDIFDAVEREGFMAPLAGYEDHITASGRLIRHDFDRMRADAHAKQFGMLIVGRIDRFSRNITMGMLHTFELILAGVYVYFCDEDVIAGLDHNWREIVERKFNEATGVLRTITKNNRTTMRRRRRKGEWLGRAPFGWKLSDDRLVVSQHPTEWPVVAKMIALLRTDRLSLQGIADSVTADGHRTRAGLPIRKHFVDEVLHHPLLKGYWPMYASRGKASPDYQEVKKFEGPLSETEFDELAAILHGRALAHQKPERIKHDYVLLKLLRCGEIDSATNTICDVVLNDSCGTPTGITKAYTNYFHPAFKGCCTTATVYKISDRNLLRQLDELFASAALPPAALEVLASHVADTAGAARIDRDLVRKHLQAELERADLGYPHGAYGDDPRPAFEKWQRHRGEVMTKLAGLGEDAPALRQHEIQQVRDLPQIWAAGNTAERRQTLRALFTAMYVVREPRMLPNGKNARNTARISRIEPRPEYAELIGLAFSGSMSPPRPLKSHRPPTEFGDAARAFVRWLADTRTGRAA